MDQDEIDKIAEDLVEELRKHTDKLRGEYPVDRAIAGGFKDELKYLLETYFKYW